jgi:hypothetical protein
MPSWTQIRASELMQQVPIIWSYSFDRVTGHFTGRLAGERISQVFGKNISGISPEEVHPPDAVGAVKAIFMRVVSEPAVYRSTGRVFKQLDRYGLGERMILPLAEDGALADAFLGVTDYDLYRQPGTPVQVFTEAEAWFSLSGPRS